MKKIIYGFIALFCFTASSTSVAETTPEYVEKCKSEVGFTKLPELNCQTDGFQFQQFDRTPINDYVGFRRIADMVDLAFACRWVSGDTAAGAELIVHNRANGNTCFFSAKLAIVDLSIDDPLPTRVSSTLISPTASNAFIYWDTPDNVNRDVRCVNCHVAGPYVITSRIAPFMARFGLINNGHDTLGDAPNRYHAVGSTFSQWDSIVRGNIGVLEPKYNCAGSCHVMGGRSTQMRREGVGGFELQLSPNDFFIKSAFENGSMPPIVDSPYRWVNMDTPNATGDYETLSKLDSNYHHFWCSNPSFVEAHVVDSDLKFRTGYGFPNKLRTFNLRDGLLCKDSDQTNGGKCANYQTHYLCSDGRWTPMVNKDTVDDGQDNEPRPQNVCAAPLTAIAIQAQQSNARGVVISYGPNDRLVQFDNKGLACKNSDQPDGKCSNYVVRFTCP